MRCVLDPPAYTCLHACFQSATKTKLAQAASKFGVAFEYRMHVCVRRVCAQVEALRERLQRQTDIAVRAEVALQQLAVSSAREAGELRNQVGAAWGCGGGAGATCRCCPWRADGMINTHMHRYAVAVLHASHALSCALKHMHSQAGCTYSIIAPALRHPSLC